MSVDAVFEELTSRLFKSIQAPDVLVVDVLGETTLFMRLNRSLIRQTTHVKDGNITLSLYSNGRKISGSVPFVGHLESDTDSCFKILSNLQNMITDLPQDPYSKPPQNNTRSHVVHQGELLSDDDVIKCILEPAQGLDMVGIYSGGTAYRGLSTSAGAHHWFATDSFSLDFSLYNQKLAAKNTYGGTIWSQQSYLDTLETTKTDLVALNKTAVEVPRGKYRCYLSPNAVAEIFGLLSWGAFSEKSIQSGGSFLALAKNKKSVFSPKFHLRENFRLGLSHQFNDNGGFAQDTMDLIHDGQLVNTFICDRSAQEFDLQTNHATNAESFRSTEIMPGSLNSKDILSAIGTGVYLNHLHYLNWSDRTNGRITGMTRFACFWVEKGQIIGPIQDMRFDVHIMDLLGQNLIDLTDTAPVVPEVLTYDHRHIKGIKTPGLLVNNFEFTF